MLRPYQVRADGGRLETSRVVSSSAPLFSWVLGGSPSEARQSARRLRVSCGARELWDSGWLEGDEQRAAYAGEPLPECRESELSVWIRDSKGIESEPCCERFIYGGLKNWDAAWIGASEDVYASRYISARIFTPAAPPVDACTFAGSAAIRPTSTGGSLTPGDFPPRSPIISKVVITM